MALLDKWKERVQGSGGQLVLPDNTIEEILAAKAGKGLGVSSTPKQSSLQLQAAQNIAQTTAANDVIASRLQQAEFYQKAQDQEQQFKFQTQQERLRARMTEAADVSAFTRGLKQVRFEEQQTMTAQQQDAKLRTQDMTARATMALRNLAAERRLDLDNIFADNYYGEQELHLRKDAADLEYKAQLLAFSDTQYLDELKRIGAQRELDNQMAFEQEALRLSVGHSMAELLKGLESKGILNQQVRDTDELTQTISGETDIQIADSIIRGEMERAKWGSVATIAAEGLKKANDAGWFSRNTDSAEQMEADSQELDAANRRLVSGGTKTFRTEPVR